MWLEAWDLDSPKPVFEFQLLPKFLKPKCQFSHLQNRHNYINLIWLLRALNEVIYLTY